MEKQFSPKDPKEMYQICFDFSYVLGKWERLLKLKKHTKILAIDTTDGSDVTDIILDSSKQKITWKKVHLWVRGGEVGHSYRFSTEILRTNKGTRLSPLTGVMNIEEK